MTGASLTIALTAIAVLLVWLAPRVGVRARWNRWLALRHRIRVEDALKHMLAVEHRSGRATGESVAGSLGLRSATAAALVASMEREGLVRSRAGALSLTRSGREYALQVVRAHRLWERYLGDETDVPLLAIHEAADRVEHHLTADQADALDAQLGYPPTDPHGDPIPTSAGQIGPFPGVPLTDWADQEEAEVTHLEDEPADLFETVVGEGLAPGSRLRITERGRGIVHLDVDGRRVSLPSVAAANVHVSPVRGLPEPSSDVIPLARLERDQLAEVIGIDDQIRGLARRRLLDLGLTPGARVRPELEPLFGRPRAFRIRHTLVALREEQAAGIRVRPIRSADSANDAGGESFES